MINFKVTKGFSMSNESMIDRWMKKLSSEDVARETHREEMLEKLQTLFTENLIVARRLEAEIKHLPYQQLREAALKIVEQKREESKKLEQMISSLGGSPNWSEVESVDVEPDGRFNQVLKLEGELAEKLIATVNLAEDYGYDEIMQELMKFRDAHHEQIDDLERVIMKINATL